MVPKFDMIIPGPLSKNRKERLYGNIHRIQKGMGGWKLKLSEYIKVSFVVVASCTSDFLIPLYDKNTGDWGRQNVSTRQA